MKRNGKKLTAFLLAGFLTLTGTEGLLQPAQEVQAAVDGNVSCTDTEWEVLRLVNKERMKYGCQPLTIHENLQKASKVRSKELRQVFDHYRPNGEVCFTVLDEFHCNDRMAGENIAIDFTTPARVMDAWMNSFMHRMNILTYNYSHIGVGHYKKSRDYWTQLFTGTCAFTSMEIVGNSEEYVRAVPRGTKLENMDLTIRVTCKHGDSYLPVDPTYCSGYNPNATNNKVQNVQVSCLGQSTNMKVLVHSKLPAVTGLKAEPYGNSAVKLSWTKPKGIDHYYLEYSTKPEGPFKETVLENFDGSTTAIRNLKPGTKYYFRLAPVKKVGEHQILGDFAKTIYMRTAPATPEITKIDNSRKGSLTLTWNRSKGAAAYRIFYSPTKNGPYKAIGYVKDSAKCTYTHSGLKKGRNGYYKIRPYIRIGSRNYYGSYSAVKYAAVK